ncbi:sensor histidine kinase [Micromonospora sp. CPCC 206061]|uniref:sensor histidine kinase n=1 Tax=Micromonospora sp. CPCC 206061 TaxID=3122410 RepID=UPI002FF117A0
MQRRLLITYLSLLAAVLAGLSVPLGVAVASRNAQEMFIDRLNDTARFASLAEPALRTGYVQTLEAELRQYDEMFGIAAAVTGRDGRLVLTSRDDLDVAAEPVRARVEAALSGERAGFGGGLWPWSDEPLVVAEPIGRGGDIIGVAVTVSPSDALHALTLRNWALLLGLSLLVLVVGAVAAVPLTRWMLRPVRDLDDAALAWTEGRFGDRVPAGSGPPELRQLTASFNTMAERIATLVERQRSFVSYASHQLRTPLATMRLSLDNLGPAVRDDGADDYRMVAEEIVHMGRMCDALLAYARAEATADEVVDVDAATVADERVAVWRQAAELAGVTLSRAGADRAPARAAPEAIDQALDALLSNAVKFAGAGATVTVTVEPSGSDVDIHVVDTGPGMPPDDLARAAQPFWRRSAHQNVEGSGLGVTVADALIAASGGRLDLLPAEPHGLHARVRLRAAS